MTREAPSEAVDTYLAAHRTVLSILDAHGKFLVSPRGGYVLGARCSLILNGETGLSLGAVGVFRASAQFEIVASGVSTRCAPRAYSYKLTAPHGTDLWRLHWHPFGRSPHREPHIHLPQDFKRHLPVGYISFVDALKWLIEDGAPLRGSRGEAFAALAAVASSRVFDPD